MILLIDGDALVYKAGFVAEESWYDMYTEDGVRHTYKYLKDVENALDTAIIKRQEPRAATFAIYNLEMMMRFFSNKFKPSNIVIYLSHDDIHLNHRYQMYSEYKQNRKGKHKPLHYTNLRNYLIGRYNATVVEGIEADDALGLSSVPNETIVVSHDKDLLMVPGYHYSLTHKRLFKSEDPGKLVVYRDKAGNAKLVGTGYKWFCAQLLLGDDADNIKGIKGYGPIKIQALLGEQTNVLTMQSIVQKIYEEKGKAEAYEINCKLLWIQRAGYVTHEVYLNDVRTTLEN